jgi:hypothetical protein
VKSNRIRGRWCRECLYVFSVPQRRRVRTEIKERQRKNEVAVGGLYLLIALSSP